MDLGAPELLIILAIAVLIFGGSRVAELGASLGKGIKEFKKEMSADEPPPASGEPPAVETPTIVANDAIEPGALKTDAFDVGRRVCLHCGAPNAVSARFCSECGTPFASTSTPAETQV